MEPEMTWWAVAAPSRVVFKTTIGRTAKAKSAAPIIDSFVELSEGWHYGEGRGATEAAAKAARKVDAILLETEVRAIEVYPSIDGGIAVYGFYENQHIEIACHPGGHRMELCHEIDDRPIHEEDDIALDDVMAYVEGLSWGSRSYAYSSQNFTVTSWADSHAKLFKILKTAVDHPVSVLNVREKGMERSADMFTLVTIRTPQVTRRFYGELTPTNYPMGEWQNTPRQIETHAT